MSTEFLIRVLTGERPLDGPLHSVSCPLPRVDFALKKLSAGDAPVQALATEDADLHLRHVQPTRVLGRVLELHSAQELGRCASAQYVVEAFSEVGVQIVQNQVNPASLGIPIGQQVADERNEVNLASVLGAR